jgi:VCBS repeat-containing protein
MKTESLLAQDSDAAGSTGARSERAVSHQNSELSEHLKQYLVAQLQDKNAGQPNQAPGGFWHQVPQASSSDYHLPQADRIIRVKLSAGETTFHVPANTTFDTIRIVGHDLVLVQKDGTAIVLEDAGDKIPNIEIGDVDVPKVALEAAFTANGIQAAEGPSGNPSPSSGGDFEDARAATLGNGRGLTGFLGAEGFNFNGTSIHYPPPPLPQIALNTNAEPILRLSETHLTAGTNGVNGSDPDAALTTITGDFSVDFTPTPDVNGGVVTYALSIHGGNGTASGFIDSQTGLADVLVQNGNTIEGHVGGANGALAFTITINPNTGVVTFTEDRAVFETQTSTNPSANIATMSSNVVTLTATITDGLGHQASASLDLGKQISLTDDGPSIVANAATVPALTLSEADLTAATNGVDGSSPNAALTTITGHFAGDFTDTSGADGLKSTTYALSIAGGNGTASGLVDSQTGQADVLVQNGNTIEGHVGSANGALAFTITLDPATGDVTFTEDRAIDNNNAGSAGVSLAPGIVTLTQTLIDNDGTPASASIDLGAKLAITDDGPSIVANAATAPGLTLSEADLTSGTNGINGSTPNLALTSVTGHFAGDFTDTSGADGLKSTTYALSIAGGNGAASGLVDSQTGQADVLVQNGNTIEGHVGSANGALAFTITVDPATGDITFTEDRAVVQAQDGSNPSGEATSFTAGVVTLTQTITDNDGTTASASVDLGGKLSITDDGPSVTTNAATVPGLTLSETHLTATTNNNVNGSSPNAALTVAVGHFAGDFTDVSGADGLKSTTYALSITGGNGTASGLIDSQTGSKDVLVLNGNTIEGHVGSANGALAFTIAVDPATGDITFTEDRAVENNNTGSTGVSLSAGVVTLTQTLTDNDGTTTSANVDLGPKLSITDDGPSITTNAAPTLTLSENNLTFLTNGINGTDPDFKLTHTTADFSKAFTDTSGADGLKSVAYALSISHQGVASGLTDSQTGQADILFQNGNTITGFVGHTGIVAFTITIDPKTGELTFTEDRAVVQTQDGSDPSGNAATLASGVVTLTQTITDNDGTTASASVDVGSNLSITDDGPKISTAPFLEPGLVVSESHLTAGTNGVSGSDPNSFLTHASGDFSFAFVDTPGADGLKSISYTLTIGNGGVSGFVDSQTHQNDVLVQTSATTITGYVGSYDPHSSNNIVAFTISVNPHTGVVTFTEERAVVQAQNGHNPSQDLASFATGAVTLTQTIVDNDGSTASANLDISKQVAIADDGPSISVSPQNEAKLTVSEADLQAVTNGGVDGTVHNGATTATGDFSTNFSDTFGADGKAASGAVSYALSIGNPAPHSHVVLSGMVDSQTGLDDVLVQVNATTIEGHVNSANGALAFTISVDPATGIVTFTEDRAVVQQQNGQAPSGNVASLTNGAVVLTQTITDGDGTTTSANLDIGAQLRIKDDGPQISVSTISEPSLSLNEAHLPTGTNPNSADTSTATSFSGLFTDKFGADGPSGGTTASGTNYTLSIGTHGTATGLTDTVSGLAVTLVQNGSGEIDGVINAGLIGQTTVFSIKVDGGGDVTFKLDRAMEDNNGPASLPENSVTLTQTITDGDGTSVSAGVDISQQLSVTDDAPKAPVLTVSHTVGVDETPGVQTSGGATDVLYSSLPTAIAALFSGLANVGTDTNVPAGSLDHGALSFAASGASLVSVGTPVFGADGAATSNSETYALKLEGTASGLTLTDGTAITLSISNGMIIGTAGTDSVNSALSGKVAFAIAIDSASGEVYVAQYLSLHQPTASNPNDFVTLAANSVGVTVTLTDGDGTQSSTSSDVSTHVQFYDDGPSIAAVQTAYVADVANSSFNGTWHPTFGADGPSFTAPVSLAMGSAPAGLTYSVTDTGHQINGHEVFEVQVTGTASYTFFEYTSAAATGTEMFAFTDQAGVNPFFTLDVLANGTYSFDLEATNLPGGGKTITFASGGEHDFFYSANGSSSLTGGDYNLFPPNFGLPSNYDVLITAAGPFNDVGISNGKMGVDGSQLNSGETLDFSFGTTQSAVTIGVAAGENASIERLEVTIWNAAHNASHTEILTQTDGSNIVVDQANWGGNGSNTWFTDGISEVDVTNIATGFQQDSQLSLTSVGTGTQSASVPPTTLDFNAGATDGDGDSSTANLAVNLVTPPAAGAGSYAEFVSESSLPTGSSPTGHPVVDTVQVSFTAGTDNADVTLDPSALTTALPGFQGLTWQVVNGAVEGFQGSTEVVSFVITSGATIQAGQTGTVTVTETLLAPIDGDNGGTTGDLGTLNVVASDVNNPSINATDQITVGVLDDKPIAVADVAADTSGQALSANVITGVGETSGKDTPGADGGLSVVGVEAGSHPGDTVTGGVGTVIGGAYGTLTLEANGSYIYTAHPDTTGLTGTETDTFTYTVKDADGSPSTATLTLNVGEVHPTASAATGTVYEAGLPNGSGVGPTTTELQGTLSFSEPGDTVRVTSITYNGTVITLPTDGANFVIGLGPGGAAHAELTINDTGAYTYKLIGPEAAVGGSEAPDVVTYTVTDAEGNTNTSTMTFTIVDDKPVAVADVAADASGHAVSGNVSTNDIPGADGGLSVIGVEAGSNAAAVTTGLGTAIVTALGTLTMDSNGDGGYTYTAKPNESGTDTFTYTVKDADGSTATTTLTINVNEVQPTASAATGTVYEAGLSNGSHVGTTTVTQTGALSFSESGGDTVTLTSINGQSVAQSSNDTTITGAHGTLMINENGSYSYTLTSPETGSNGVEAPDVFTYTVTDSHGNTSTNTLTFAIVDDKPVANADTANATVGQTVTADAAHGLFGTIANGGAGDISGADSPASVTGVVATSNGNAAGTAGTAGADGIPYTVTGAEGTLTLSGDGSYSYVAKSNATPGSTDTFTYTIKDADGSTAQNTLTFSIAAAAVPFLVYESGLPGGSNTGNEPTTATTEISIASSTHGQSVTLDSSALLHAIAGYPALVWSSTNNGTELIGKQNGQIIVEFQITSGATIAANHSGTVTITETLFNPLEGNNGGGAGDLGTLHVVATPASGPSATQSISVGIVDDAPVFQSADHGVIAAGATTDLIGHLSYLTGADTSDTLSFTGVANSKTAPTDTSLKWNGQELYEYVSNGAIHGEVKGIGNSYTDVFTVSLNATTSTYDFHLDSTPGNTTVTLPFAFNITDNDGSTAAGAFDVTVSGATQQVNYSVNSSDTSAAAFDGTYTTLTDHSGTLGNSSFASATNVLVGGPENDIFISNFGPETMTGGGGSDIFQLHNINVTDVITDFSSNDAIDLTAILNDVDSTKQLADYVTYNQSTGALSVDPTGTGKAADFHQVATLSSHPTAQQVTVIVLDSTTQHLAHTHHTG